ncbi:MAG: hypothetical protein Kow0069_14520 [Promethearchaeota archaeon]
MRVRRHARLKARTAFVACLALAPLAFVGSYAATLAGLYESVTDFSRTAAWDPSDALPANYSRLAQLAEYFDDRFERFHAPLNFSTDAVFADDACTVVDHYVYSDNGAQWTGLALTSFVYKYVAAKMEGDEEMRQDALRVIRRLVNGFCMLLAVPNGGVGPGFPGTLARGWAGPEHRDVAAWYFSDDPRHHNGTGAYSNFRWRASTSNDEYSGLYGGLAAVLKHVTEPDVRHLAGLVVEQVAGHMLATNFLGLNWHGGPTGVDQKAKFFSGGAWALLLLKMAALVNPGKYERLYYHYAAEELYAAFATEGGPQEVVANYYAYAFGYHVVFSLATLEEDDRLRGLYLSLYQKSLRRHTANHRNPFYNAIHLALTCEPGDDPALEADVVDQLVRYDCPYHFPDRALGHAPIPADQFPKVDDVEELLEFLENDPHGSLYLPFFGEVRPGNTYYARPLTVEYLPGDIFVWEKNPFQAPPDPQFVNPRYEYAGFSFPLVYWIARAHGFVPPPGGDGA